MGYGETLPPFLLILIKFLHVRIACAYKLQNCDSVRSWSISFTRILYSWASAFDVYSAVKSALIRAFITTAVQTSHTPYSMYNSPPKAHASLARAKAQLEAAADHPFRVRGRRKPAATSHAVVADCRRRKKTTCPPTTAPIRGKKRKATIASRVQRRKQPKLSERRQVDQSWQPPVSPYGLIQESLWREPWKLLVACMLLNKTSGCAVSPPYLPTLRYNGTASASKCP